MKMQQQTVWTADDGLRNILTCKQPGRYYVAVGDCDVAGLIELWRAVTDALQKAGEDAKAALEAQGIRITETENAVAAGK